MDSLISRSCNRHRAKSKISGYLGLILVMICIQEWHGKSQIRAKLACWTCVFGHGNKQMIKFVSRHSLSTSVTGRFRELNCWAFSSDFAAHVSWIVPYSGGLDACVVSSYYAVISANQLVIISSPRRVFWELEMVSIWVYLPRIRIRVESCWLVLCCQWSLFDSSGGLRWSSDGPSAS